MMKKIFLFALIPLLSFGAYVLVNGTNTQYEEENLVDTSPMPDLDWSMNTYIEDPDKTTLFYNFTIPNSFNKMSENDDLELYLEPDTLAIAVRVKANGYVYSSYNFNDPFSGKSEAIVNPIKSGVVLDLYKESTPTSTSYLDYRANAVGEDIRVAEADIQTLNNGFVASVDFSHPEIMIKFDMNVTIDGDRLNVHIPRESILEYNPNMWNSNEQFYVLRNIVVFPYFGSTKGENDGYVVIPDGSGALITLDKTPEERASFSLDVYGRDMGYMSFTQFGRTLSIKPTQRLTLPLFGMVHDVGNAGFYVVSDGSPNYTILNFKSTGVINDYYNTYFSYRYRQSYEQYQSRSNQDQFRLSFQDNPNEYDVDTTYTFLSGSEANYVGIAKSYQNDLINQGVLTDSHRVDYSETPTKVDVIGTEITEGVLRLKLQEVTTYQEMVDLLKTLQDDGYTELNTSLKTFNINEWGYRFGVYRELGGRSDFETLLQYVSDNEIAFSYYLDYVRTYNDSTRYDAQTLSKRSIFFVELAAMFIVHRVNETKNYSSYATDDISDLSDYGISSVALNGFDRAVFTSWDDRVVYGQENMDNIVTMLTDYTTNQFRVGLYNPDQYLFQYMSEYYNAPISSSEYTISAASIPFVQLVVGGYVDMYAPYMNFTSNEDVTLLRLVEFGVFPSYTFTGGSAYDLKHTNASNVYISEYEILKNRINTYYETINSGLRATIQNEMIGHHFVDTGVVRVEYLDGTTILLNYNDVSVTVNTVVVPALGYVVIS